MRNPTKATLGIVTLAILAGSYQAGIANATATQTTATGNVDPTVDNTGNTATSTTTTEVSAAPSAAATSPANTGVSAGSSATTSGSTGSSTSSNSSSSSSGSSSTSSGSTSSGSSNTSTGSSGSSSTATVSHTGSAISYRFGVMQLEVVKTGSTITAINLIQATVDGGRYQSVPSALVQSALSAQGTSFSNISRATFTSEAFRSALESALAQF